MRTMVFKNFRDWHGQWYALLAVVLLSLTSSQAQPTITTLGGGDPNVTPKYQGYRNGATLTSALFRNPSGLAITKDNSQLLVADRDNNMVRLCDLSVSMTYDLFTMTNYVKCTNVFKKPVGVVIDKDVNLFVLNRNAGTNGFILQIDYTG